LSYLCVEKLSFVKILAEYVNSCNFSTIKIVLLKTSLMKTIKMLIAAAITFGSLAAINSSLPVQQSSAYTFVRVRTVPGSNSDDKKKENDNSNNNTNAPHQESTSS